MEGGGANFYCYRENALVIPTARQHDWITLWLWVQPAGCILAQCRTLDQARAVVTFLDAAFEKTLRATVALTAARGRGKSAAVGLAIAGSLALGYSNIFVTAPSPENLHTLFEFVLKVHMLWSTLQGCDRAQLNLYLAGHQSSDHRLECGKEKHLLYGYVCLEYPAFCMHPSVHANFSCPWGIACRLAPSPSC